MPTTRSQEKSRADTVGATPAKTLPTTTSTNEGSINTSNIGLEGLPLELVAAIADYVHEFSHLAAMMLGSRRLRDGVSLSRQWRIANEVMTEVLDLEMRRKILFDRQQIILHASRLGNNTRLLRYIQLTRKEAYSLCLPVACVHGHIEFVRYLMNEFDIKDKVASDQRILPCQLDSGGCDDTLERDFKTFRVESTFEYGPFEIACACPTGLPLVKFFHEECGVSVPPPAAIICAAREGRLDTVKYLHTAFGLDVLYGEDVEDEEGLTALQWACMGGHLPVVTFLHTAFLMTVDDALLVTVYGRAFEAYNALQLACKSGHLPVVAYLHTGFGLTADDARDNDNFALRLACGGGYLPVVEYLRTAFGLTADDVRNHENYALRLACQNGHLPVVKYLHIEFGLTVDDARAEENHCLCECGHLPVVKYLHTVYGLTADDVRAFDNLAFRRACEGGDLPLVQYLHTAFGLTADDASALGNYALMCAHEGGHTDVVAYLQSSFELELGNDRAHGCI